jgi:predicted ATPase
VEIKQLNIQNYKSIEKIELHNLSPFSVFVGPNASGKSNIFESIEFLNTCNKTSNVNEAIRLFGKADDIINKKNIQASTIHISFNLDSNISPSLHIKGDFINSEFQFIRTFRDLESADFFREDSETSIIKSEILDFSKIKQFYNFTRLFINNPKIKRNNYLDDSRLNADASNLESVLKRVLKNGDKRSLILEELSLLIPGFDNIEIRSDDISGTESLLIFEKGSDKPFNKHLISDGTYNIIALLTAVYQSDEPQFLCIEEPENGLNPFVAKEFVRIFRNACQDFGHFIWINTHSQSILSELKQEEVIIVDKINGGTVAKQITGIDLKGLRIDEALFTNVLGGGTPW